MADKKYKHATLYQLGSSWVTLFSNERKVCDLVNHTAKDQWDTQMEAIQFVERWLRPKDSTIFVSYLDIHGQRQGFWLKQPKQLLSAVVAPVKEQLLELQRQKKERQKRLGIIDAPAACSG